MRIGIYGSCQAASFATAAKRLTVAERVFAVPAIDGPDVLSSCDLIFVQSEFVSHLDLVPELKHIQKTRISVIPTFYFSGFFPDCVMEIQSDGTHLLSPFGNYNSSIILHGFLNGCSIENVVALFNLDTYNYLGFHEHWGVSRRLLIDDMNNCGLDGAAIFKLFCTSKFAYTPHHPKLSFVEMIIRQLFRRMKLPLLENASEISDPLSIHGEWPVYPGIADNTAVCKNYDFCCGPPPAGSWIKSPIKLEDFVRKSFAMYSLLPSGAIQSDRLKQQAALYAAVKTTLNATVKPKLPKSGSERRHVYSGLPTTSYWQRAIADCPIAEMDPVISTKFTLLSTEKIATAGSCFAQHIAKTLLKSGNNFFVTEPAPPELDHETAFRKHYGVFSARYGNIYTARQLHQLLRRSTGEFRPVEHAWQRSDGKFVDPFRPQIDPDGFSSADEVVKETHRHLNAVRTLVGGMDVLVFTLGLTETWEDLADGAVFPVAPGVAAGEMDPKKYRFKNFNFDEVRADLRASVDLMRKLNPSVKIVLTVSPVPLVATYENQHVLVSTIYSKSVLRAALQDVVNDYGFVDYFPSYELIAGSYNCGCYFEADKRSVKQDGVDHVMRVFRRHYLSLDERWPSRDAGSASSPASAITSEIRSKAKMLCDEELLDHFLAVHANSSHAKSHESADPRSHERVLGEDGWVFLGNLHQNEFDQVLGRYDFDQKHFEDWTETLDLMQRFARRRGAHLVFCVSPAKTSIYLDKLLENDRIAARASVQDRLLATAERKGISFIDMRGTLIEGKKRANTYSPLDSHWTDYGGVLAWNNIAKTLDAFRLGFNFSEIGEVDSIETVDGPAEMAELIDSPRNNPCTIPKLRRKLPDYTLYLPSGDARQVGSRKIDVSEYPAKAVSDRPLTGLRCLLLSDSTGAALTPYVVAAFSETYLRRHHVTHDNAYFNFAGNISSLKPDVILIAMTERYIAFPLGDIDYWRVAEQFDLRSAAAVYEKKGLAINGDETLVSPSYISFDAVRDTRDDRYLKVCVHGDGSGEITLAYTRAGAVTSKVFRFGPGINEMYFVFPGQVDGEHFWLARGDGSASCRVEDIRVL